MGNVRSFLKKISLETQVGASGTDITPKVMEFLKESGVNEGLVTVFTRHTTTGISINENEERLRQDILMHLEQNSPKNKKYLHDDINLRDCPPNERINGHAHLKAIQLCASQCIPVSNGQMELGKWQAVLFFDFDGARKREIAVHIMGE